MSSVGSPVSSTARGPRACRSSGCSTTPTRSRPGHEGWEIVPELAPAEGEPVVQKHWGDSFEDTDLEEHLARLRVGRLVVTGAQTDACVRSTIHGAFTRGYDATLVGDAHTTEDLSQWGAPPPADVIAHTNLYWQFQSAPGREAGVADAAEVDFAPRP